MLQAGPITPADILNTTTLVVLALIALTGNIALAVYDRRSRRREVGVEWEERADELSQQLAAAYLDRVNEVVKDRNHWRDQYLALLSARDDERRRARGG